MSAPRLILASASPIRKRILQDAGLDFSVRVSDVDEMAIKRQHALKNTPIPELVKTLALAKAKAIDAGADEIIIGADQIMEMDGEIFDKPSDMEGAQARLKAFRGREHHLIGAVVCIQKNKPAWTHISKVTLKARNFSDGFIDGYLKSEGQSILKTVGAYKFEGMGAQLFDHVEGDFFSILGLSLLPLLAQLRRAGALPS